MRPEQEIHRAVVDHLRKRAAPGVVWFHVPNGMYAGGKRSRKGKSIQGGIMKGLGARAGVSDLILLRNSHAYALELKAPNGRPTVAQMEFMSDWIAAGGSGCITSGLDQALSILETWGLIRGKTSVSGLPAGNRTLAQADARRTRGPDDSASLGPKGVRGSQRRAA